MRRLSFLCAAWPLAALLIAGGAAHARDLAPPDALVPVELATVGVDRRNGSPVVLLREPASGRIVPIAVGHDQARSILMALRDVPAPRPMTHDLMADVIEALDARLERVLVDDLRDGTYLGVLELAVPGRDEPLRIDTRPSDGLALALRTGARIAVAEEVLERAGQPDFEAPEQGAVQALGVTVVSATPQLRESLKLPDRGGVVVSRVSGLARARGVRVGDLITGVNGETPADPMAFLALVRDTPEGEQARLSLYREGETRTVELPTDVPSGEQAEQTL